MVEQSSSRRRIDARAGYDLWAEDYDRTPNPVVAMDDRHALGLLDAHRGERVLDLGCGTGRHLRRLDRAGVATVGADFSLGMLRVARRHVPRALLVGADLQRGLPFAGARFDAALCSLVGEHLGELHRTMRDTARAVRPGGRLVFTVYHPDLAAAGKEANFTRDHVEYRLGAHPWTVEDYADRVADAGFIDLETVEYYGDDDLADRVPGADRLVGHRVLLAIRARRNTDRARPRRTATVGEPGR